MSLEKPGTLLKKLCSSAKSEVLLVSPFIKQGALLCLLNEVPTDVPVTVVTRWRVEEILSGVSDLEVWELVKNRPNSRLWLRIDLHAKYYRVDSEILLGSANLTHTALGWVAKPNLELLVQGPIQPQFENELFRGAVEVSNDIYGQIRQVVELLKAQYQPSIMEAAWSLDFEAESERGTQIPLEYWLPKLRYPESLYLAYSERFEELTSAARESAFSDLVVLSVPPGLDEASFNDMVGTLLLQMPVVSKVDRLVETAQRFGSVRSMLKTYFDEARITIDASSSWQTLMRWLLYFLPNRYKSEVPHHSEIFSRR